MEITTVFDSSFNIGSGFDSAVLTSALQPDGKIVIGGYFNHYNSYECKKVVRINSDGSFDSSFKSEMDIKDGYVWTINLQSDGKILVGGSFSKLYKGGPSCLARLNHDGSIDKTFTIGSGFGGTVRAIAILSDNKILVGGAYDSINGIKKCFISRLNPNGSLDDSFNVVNGFSKIQYNKGEVSTIALEDDEKIILGGIFTSFSDFTCTNIIRLNSDGSIDKSFNPQLNKLNKVSSIKIQKDSKIIVGFGYKDSIDGHGLGRNYILRLNADGSIDNSFITGKAFDSHLIRDIFILPNDKIIIGGWFILLGENLRKNLAIINSDGSIDTSFNPGTGLNLSVTTIAIQSNNRIIIGGYFTSYNGANTGNLALLKENILDNDTHDIFLISFDSESLKILLNDSLNILGKRIEIYDDFGNIVYFNNIILNKPNSFTIDRSKLNNEVYYLLLHDKKKYIYSKKIIIPLTLTASTIDKN